MAEWARVVATTIEKFTKGFEDAVKRERILLDRCEKMGKIDYNQGGLDFTWQVKKAQRQWQTNNGTQAWLFQPTNIYERAKLNYYGGGIVDVVTKREKLQNKGREALIDYWGELTESMMEDLHDRFAERLYTDQNAAGNSGQITGIKTMFGAPTQSISTASTTATTPRTANVADPVLVPVATYAGISTLLGAEGGTWNGRWPDVGGGVGTEALYDHFSPLMINYNSSYFNTGANNWGSNCVEAIRFGLTFSNRNIASQGKVDLVLLHHNLYRQFKSKKDSTERQIINQGRDADPKFGFRDSAYQDGAEITAEFGIPNSEGYGFNMEKFEIKSMQDKLFVSNGPIQNPTDFSWRVATDFLGNLKFSTPRTFVWFNSGQAS
jgi:hypothetical protein